MASKKLTNKELKLQLEKEGRKYGIEIDRRKSLKSIKAIVTKAKKDAAEKEARKYNVELDKRKKTKTLKATVKKIKEEAKFVVVETKDGSTHKRTKPNNIKEDNLSYKAKEEKVKKLPVIEAEVEAIEIPEKLETLEIPQEPMMDRPPVDIDIPTDGSSFSGNFMVYITKDADITQIAEKLNAEQGIEVTTKLDELNIIGVRASNRDVIIKASKKPGYSNKIKGVAIDLPIVLFDVKNDFFKSPNGTILEGPIDPNTPGMSALNYDRVHFRHKERITSLQAPLPTGAANTIASRPTTISGSYTYSASKPADGYADRNTAPKNANINEWHSIVQRLDFGSMLVGYVDQYTNRTSAYASQAQNMEDATYEYTIDFTYGGSARVDNVGRDSSMQAKVTSNGKWHNMPEFSSQIRYIYEATNDFQGGGNTDVTNRFRGRNLNFSSRMVIESKSKFLDIWWPNFKNHNVTYTVSAVLKAQNVNEAVNSPILSSTNTATGLTANTGSKTGYKGQYSSGTGNITGRGVDIYVIDTGVSGAAAGSGTSKTKLPSAHPSPDVSVAVPHREFLNETFTHPYSVNFHQERYTQISSNINEEVASPYRVFSISKALEDLGMTSSFGTGGLGGWYDEDTVFHGTAVAQCAAGYTVGMSPNARVYASKIFDPAGTSNSAAGSLDAAKGINDVIKHHKQKIAHANTNNITARPSIVNASFGFPNSLPELFARGANNFSGYFIAINDNDTDAIDTPDVYGFFDDLHQLLINEGIHVVTAAGNDTFNTEFVDGCKTASKSEIGFQTKKADPNFPFSDTNRVGLGQPKYVVGASNYSNPGDDATDFSNYGAGVNVWAPGSNIIHYSWLAFRANVIDSSIRLSSPLPAAAYPSNRTIYYYPTVPTSEDNITALTSTDGTSFSAPIVAGVIAQYLGEYPTKTPQQAFDFLIGNENAAAVSESNKTNIGTWHKLKSGYRNWEIATAGNEVRLPRLESVFDFNRGAPDGCFFSWGVSGNIGNSYLFFIIPEGMSLEEGDTVALTYDRVITSSIRPNIMGPGSAGLDLNFEPLDNMSFSHSVFNLNNISGGKNIMSYPMPVALVTANVAAVLFKGVRHDFPSPSPVFWGSDASVIKLEDSHMIKNDTRIAYQQIPVTPKGIRNSRPAGSGIDDFWSMIAYRQGASTIQVKDYFPVNTTNHNMIFSPFTEALTPVEWKSAADLDGSHGQGSTIDFNLGAFKDNIVLWNGERLPNSFYETEVVSSLPTGVTFDSETLQLSGTIDPNATIGDYYIDVVIWPTYQKRRYTLTVSISVIPTPDITTWSLNFADSKMTVNFDSEVQLNTSEATKLSILINDTIHNIPQATANTRNVTVSGMLQNAIITSVSSELVDADLGTRTFLINDRDTTYRSTLTNRFNFQVIKSDGTPDGSLSSAQQLTLFKNALSTNGLRTGWSNFSDISFSGGSVRNINAFERNLPQVYMFKDAAAARAFGITATIIGGSPSFQKVLTSPPGLVIPGTGHNIRVNDYVQTTSDPNDTTGRTLVDGVTERDGNTTLILSSYGPFTAGQPLFFGTPVDVVFSGNDSYLTNTIDYNLDASDISTLIDNQTATSNLDCTAIAPYKLSSLESYVQNIDGVNSPAVLPVDAISDSNFSSSNPMYIIPTTLLSYELDLDAFKMIFTFNHNIKISSVANIADHLQLVDSSGSAVRNFTNSELTLDTTTDSNIITLTISSQDAYDDIYDSYRISDNPEDVRISTDINFIENPCGTIADTVSISPVTPTVIDTAVIADPNPVMISWELDLPGKKITICYDQDIKTGTLIASNITLYGTYGNVTFTGSGLPVAGQPNCVAIELTDALVNDIVFVLESPNYPDLELEGSDGHIEALDSTAKAGAFRKVPVNVVRPADTILPRLTSWDLDLMNYEMTLTLSEFCEVSEYDATKFTINGYTLSNTSTLTSTADTDTFTISLSPADQTEIFNATGNTGTNVTLSATTGFVVDLSDNQANPITDISVDTFTADNTDRTRPTITSWNLDLNSDEMVVNFSESCKEFTGVADLTIVSDGNVHTLTGGTLAYTNTDTDFTSITITLTATDVTSLIATTGNSNTPVIKLRAPSGLAKDQNDLLTEQLDLGLDVSIFTKFADTTKPTLTSWTGNLNAPSLTFKFSEPVNKDTYNASLINVTGISLSNTGIDSSLLSNNNMTLTVMLTNAERDRLVVATTNGTTNNLSSSADWIYDLAETPNGIAAITTTAAVPSITPLGGVDIVKPTLDRWTLDLTPTGVNSGVPTSATGSMSLFVDEPIKSTVDVTQYTITTNKSTGNTYTLTSDSTISVTGSEILITFGTTDALEVAKTMEYDASNNISTIKANIELTATADWCTDLSILPNDALAITTGIPADDFNTTDVIKPTLVSWNLDLEADTMTLVFSEVIDPSSLDITALTIEGDSVDYTLTGTSTILSALINTNVITFELNNTDAAKLLEITGNTK